METHFHQSDERFCGTKERPRKFTTDENAVTCVYCKASDCLTLSPQGALLERLSREHAAMRQMLAELIPRAGRCENPGRVPAPNPRGYASVTDLFPCGQCCICRAQTLLTSLGKE